MKSPIWTISTIFYLEEYNVFYILHTSEYRTKNKIVYLSAIENRFGQIMSYNPNLCNLIFISTYICEL